MRDAEPSNRPLCKSKNPGRDDRGFEGRARSGDGAQVPLTADNSADGPQAHQHKGPCGGFRHACGVRHEGIADLEIGKTKVIIGACGVSKK